MQTGGGGGARAGLVESGGAGVCGCVGAGAAVGRAGRREKRRDGGRGFECRGYSERPEGGAGVVSDSCFVEWPDLANVDTGAYRLACAVGEDGDVHVVPFCAILEEHAVVD